MKKGSRPTCRLVGPRASKGCTCVIWEGAECFQNESRLGKTQRFLLACKMLDEWWAKIASGINWDILSLPDWHFHLVQDLSTSTCSLSQLLQQGGPIILWWIWRHLPNHLSNKSSKAWPYWSWVILIANVANNSALTQTDTSPGSQIPIPLLYSLPTFTDIDSDRYRFSEFSERSTITGSINISLH